MAKFEPQDIATGLKLKSGVVRVLAILAIVMLGATVSFNSFTTYVRPFEAAVKESRYGGGLEVKPYPGPGLYLTGPGVTFHRFPTVVQVLTMNTDASETALGAENSRTIPQLEIDSSDGSKIGIDATVLYRILDPYKVMTRIGPGRTFEDNAIIPKASQALKESLGRLKAEDFYDEVLRVKATDRARTEMIAGLEPLGLSVDHVLIRQYSYLRDYQSRIEDRKVQDQLVFTNQSMAEAAKMEAMRSKIEAEGQAAVLIEQQRGHAEVTKIRAEADLYSRKRQAEGDLLVKLSSAQGIELENAAYRTSAGSNNLVGMEMAEVLEGVEVIFLQSGKDGVNLLDLDRTLNMFDVK